jgi:putative transposase
VLDILNQSHRNARAARRLLRKLLKKQGIAPRVMITDKLASYAVAKRVLMPSVEHRGLNNRAENNHQPTRRRERIMKCFKSAGQAQRFLSVDDQVANLFRRPANVSAVDHRYARARAFQIWAELAGIASVA